MKILHTSDWHLGKRLERFDRSREQVEVLQEICEIAEREDVDAILVAGDLYDTYNPPIDATENFYKHLKRLSDNGKRAVIAIAGNHDSPTRIEAPDPLARECGIILAGYPDSVVRPFELDSGLQILQSDRGFLELKLPRHEAPMRLLLTPYANQNRLRKRLGIEAPDAVMRAMLEGHWKEMADQYMDDKGVNLLVAHLLMMKRGAPVPEEPDDEKPINMGGSSLIWTENVPAQVQYVALGHLHRHQNMQGGPCPCVYASSPLGYSFGEAGQQKYVVLLDLEPGQPVEMQPIALEAGMPLHRKKFESVDEAIEWLQANPACYVELYIRTDHYISGVDRTRLAQAHKRIVGPYPEFRNPELLAQHLQRVADPSRSREELFVEYVRHRNGVEPSESLLLLFREIIGEEGKA